MNQRRLLHLFLLLTAALVARSVRAQVPGQGQLVWYTSPVDDSRQAYGVYVPVAARPERGYPAVFHTHGYGWSVGTGFSDWQREWAEAHRWVLISLNARGPQFYEGIGDTATMEVVRDATARFGLDSWRLYITGASMGGTGAFRLGLRHPYTFAAALGVDGWSDYRLWHRHWYARTDMQDAIEEFRRPLLQAASPLYWAHRGQWNAVKAVVDGMDTTVWPDNGLRLFTALNNLAYERGGYDSELTLNYDKGHGGGYNLQDAYHFFLDRSLVDEPQSFLCRTYLLKHGEMYWGRVDGIRVFGLPATLASSVADDVVTVTTDNIDRFSLHLQASPVAGRQSVTVYADGLPCYVGPPSTVSFEAIRDVSGRIGAWLQSPSEQPPSPLKTPELAGPLGDVFTRPFVVAYGTLGSPAMTQQHRREASDFADGWRSFMIRRGAEPDAIGPYPEEDLPDRILRDRSLVMFGSRETSRLLQTAYEAADIPVVVGDRYVQVLDRSAPHRTYYGDNFGCFVAYPNPLCDGRHYLLIARGQWFTKPDRTVPLGLEYDMEKLPWAYPDYVVFNTDQRQLPHVLNVNNKPPVTCYQAGYFVEAGFFDKRWRPDPAITLDRVRLARPENVRLIHVEAVRASADRAEVLVVDEAGKPCPDARVTVTWPDVALSASGLSDSQGWARIAPPGGGNDQTAVRVMSVMATGAVHDFTADTAHGSDDGPVSLVLSCPQLKYDPFGNCCFALTATLWNRASQRVTGWLQPNAVAGTWTPESARFGLAAGEKAGVPLQWHLARSEDVPPGDYALTVTARPDCSPWKFGSPTPATASARVTLGLLNRGPLRIAELAAPDLVVGRPYSVSCEILNVGPQQASLQVACSIIPAGLPMEVGGRYRYLSPISLTAPEFDKAPAAWVQQPDEEPLPVGLYEAVVYVPGHPELTCRLPFSVTAGCGE